jgi:RimJ/RimL family protein N-acetyltransferase
MGMRTIYSNQERRKRTLWSALFLPNQYKFAQRTIGALGVAINSLGQGQIEQIRHHLLSLDQQDRFMRFGYAANDTQINQYIDKLNFETDDIYGIFNEAMDLVAMAHLAFCANDEQAEFGVSVSKQFRGNGFGNKLFERAAIHATNNKIKTIFIHALTENAAMLKIARKHGAILYREGSETEAYVSLGRPTIDTHFSELISEQYAKSQYDIHSEIKKFWDFVTDIQEIRQGVKRARRRAAQ